MKNPFFAPLKVHERADGSCYIYSGSANGSRYLAFNVECTLEQAEYLTHAVNSLGTLHEQLAVKDAMIAQYRKAGAWADDQLATQRAQIARLTDNQQLRGSA